jgi:glucose-6-phosphate 1-dehydrogenase
MRLRISPDVTIALGLRVKHPGERMEGQDVELILTEQETAFMPPYQRLFGGCTAYHRSIHIALPDKDAQPRRVLVPCGHR